MFEGDLTVLSTADLLEPAAEHRAAENRAAARLLEHALVYADRHHPDRCGVRSGRRSFDGRERGVVLGGEGCPEVAEFAPAEFGLLLGVSAGVAAGYIGQALALRHRFPFTWARVQCGEATPWRACRIAAACVKLSAEAARYVDKRVAMCVDSLTPYRLDKLVTAARMHADPGAARAEAEEKARERGVFVGRSDEHGTKTVYIRAASGAVVRFKATIASIADALRVLGHTGPRAAREAQAVGIIADPAYTEQLLRQARDQLLNPGDAAEPPSATPATSATSGADPAGRPAAPASPAASTGGGRGRPTTPGTDAGDHEPLDDRPESSVERNRSMSGASPAWTTNRSTTGASPAWTGSRSTTGRSPGWTGAARWVAGAGRG